MEFRSSPKFSIAFASERLGVLERGGERQILELAAGLSRLGHHVRLYTGGDVAVPAAVEVTTLRDNRVMQRLASAAAKSENVRWTGRIAHARNWEFASWAYAKMAISPPDFVVPVIPPIHERFARWLRRTRGTKLIEIGLGGPAHDRMRVACAPDLYVVSSARGAAEARAQAAGLRVAIIPPGVDVANFSPRGESAALDLPRPIVGVFGALIPCKRVALAIEAVAHHGAASLLVIGRGEEHEAISARGHARLGERFSLIEGVSAAHMPAYYRAIDVLAFPANSDETFGMVLLEAMACGKPVVATDDIVRREIIGDAGELCDVRDPVKFAAALATATARTYPGVARAEGFSWSHSVAAFAEALSSVAR